MRFESFVKQILKVAFGVLVVALASPGFSQVVSPVSENGFPISVGGGFSYWDVDWGVTKMEGGTLWADWQPSYLRGFGVEAEGRDISLDRGYAQNNFREATAGGGVIYAWDRYRDFRPYAKYLVSFGGINFDFYNPALSFYTHDTRTVTAPGFGLEARAYKHLWARVDYEYQFWPDLFGTNKVLNPQGLTFGLMYDFRHRNRYYH